MSLIVYISFPFSVLPGFFALRVRSAGHALTSNKGCTKRQSLPNCQQNGRPDPEYRTGECGQRCYFVRNGTDAKVQRSETSFRKGRPTGRQPNSAAHISRLQESRHPGRTAEGSRPGKSSKKKARQKTAEGKKGAGKKGNDRQDQGKRNKDRRNNSSRNKAKPQRENRQNRKCRTKADRKNRQETGGPN